MAWDTIVLRLQDAQELAALRERRERGRPCGEAAVAQPLVSK
jgi:hypothetical protein